MSGRQAQRGNDQQRKALGRAIAAARVGKGLEQDEFARLIGRTQTWVSRVEDGEGTLSVFEYARIADLLDISPEVLRRLTWAGYVKPKVP